MRHLHQVTAIVPENFLPSQEIDLQKRKKSAPHFSKIGMAA
jgi:hypothetical protein